MVTQSIGPEGGTIEAGGAVVTFPKGEVATSTTVTISVQSTTTPPEGFVALSKLFECEPSGTEFAQPVEGSSAGGSDRARGDAAGLRSTARAATSRPTYVTFVSVDEKGTEAAAATTDPWWRG